MESMKATKEPEQRPVLDDLFDGIHIANERLNKLNNRLRRITDKVFGPRPEEAPKPGQPTAPGAASSFRDEVEVLHHQFDSADQLLMQLERFVRSHTMNREDIARVAHEVNKAYCEALGDQTQLSWEEAPDWQKESARGGVALHMAAEAGPEASHESWMAHKLADGWQYGSIKNPETKEHPCLVPFSDLPPHQQAKDFIFRAIVHALSDTRPAPLSDIEQTKKI